MKLFYRYIFSFIILGIIFLLIITDFNFRNLELISFITSYSYSLLFICFLSLNINHKQIQEKIKIPKIFLGILILIIFCLIFFGLHYSIELYFQKGNLNFDFILLLLFFHFLYYQIRKKSSTKD